MASGPHTDSCLQALTGDGEGYPYPNHEVREDCSTSQCDSELGGNKICNPLNNNFACNYDNGDCCGENVNCEDTEFCACIDPSFEVRIHTKDSK